MSGSKQLEIEEGAALRMILAQLVEKYPTLHVLSFVSGLVTELEAQKLALGDGFMEAEVRRIIAQGGRAS